MWIRIRNAIYYARRDNKKINFFFLVIFWTKENSDRRVVGILGRQRPETKTSGSIEELVRCYREQAFRLRYKTDAKGIDGRRSRVRADTLSLGLVVTEHGSVGGVSSERRGDGRKNYGLGVMRIENGRWTDFQGAEIVTGYLEGTAARTDADANATG